jgi:hypothetical protein
LDKGKWVGIAGGVIFFLILLFFFVYINSDFDQELINDMDYGTPPSSLITQIEAKSYEEKLTAKKELESHVTSTSYWSKPGLASTDDFNYDKRNYDISITAINKLQELRKEFVEKKISKDEFIMRAPQYKEYIQNYQWYL